MSLRSAPTTRPAHTRSAVSNGRRLFVVGDGKTEWARRYRDIYEAHISDAGGADLLSEAQLQLCRRAASLAIEAERMEGELSEGKPVDIDVLGRLTGHLGRTYDRLGLKRVARDLTPTIDAIIARHTS